MQSNHSAELVKIQQLVSIALHCVQEKPFVSFKVVQKVCPPLNYSGQAGVAKERVRCTKQVSASNLRWLENW